MFVKYSNNSVLLNTYFHLQIMCEKLTNDSFATKKCFFSTSRKNVIFLVEINMKYKYSKTIVR